MKDGWTTLTCAECEHTFAVQYYWMRAKQEDHSTFYCPNGHRQYFPKGPTELETMRQQRDRLKQEMAQKEDLYLTHLNAVREERDSAKRVAAAQKGVVTKFKKRASEGVCLCCNRTFKDLSRHMHNKHPDFSKPKETS